MNQPIFDYCQKFIETTMTLGEVCSDNIGEASSKITSRLLSGNTIFSCGEGCTIPLAQLFNHYLTAGYEIERPCFPALNINCMANNGMSYADSLRTHGRKADMLFTVSPGANNRAIIETIESAHEQDMSVVLLSAANDDLISRMLHHSDVMIATSVFPGQMSTTAQLQAIQCICKLIDDKIFGGD